MQTSTGIYFEDGELVTKRGEVAVYSMNGELFLEVGPGRNLWTLESEYKDYMDQFEDKPKGNCLEIGLGLGVASRCIMTYPKVTSLTTVELRADVIKAHDDIIPIMDNKLEKWMPYDPERHTIVNDDGLKYMIRTKEKFDFVFMDFYKHVDEETLPVMRDMVNAAKGCLNEGGIISGWFDPYTPIEFIDDFYELFT